MLKTVILTINSTLSQNNVLLTCQFYFIIANRNMSAISVQNEFNTTSSQHAQIIFRTQTILVIQITTLYPDQTMMHCSDIIIVSNAHAQIDCFLILVLSF